MEEGLRCGLDDAIGHGSIVSCLCDLSEIVMYVFSIEIGDDFLLLPPLVLRDRPNNKGRVSPPPSLLSTGLLSLHYIYKISKGWGVYDCVCVYCELNID